MEYINVITNAQTGETIEVPFTQAEIDAWITNEKAEFVKSNKQQAKDLLTQTDWTTIGDVGNPQTCNPYLANQSDFINYRNQLRAIVFNPPDNEITFPAIPDEIWITA